MDHIMALAEQIGHKVIDDCAQAHGAIYKGRRVGSIGHVGAWSFCQDKIMTTGGEGGMVTVNDEQIWRSMWAYKDHGKSYAAVYERQHPPGFRWLHESFGTNWRMLEVQATIGRIQLKRMTKWTSQRHANATRLAKIIKPFSYEGGPLRLPDFKCTNCDQSCANGADQIGKYHCLNAYYKFYVYVQEQNLAPGWNRDRIIEAINKEGVPCYQGSCSEVYLERAFDSTGWRPHQRLPTARKLGETSLMFLVHPTLTSTEMERACEVLTRVLSEAING